MQDIAHRAWAAGIHNEPFSSGGGSHDELASTMRHPAPRSPTQLRWPVAPTTHGGRDWASARFSGDVGLWGRHPDSFGWQVGAPYRTVPPAGLDGADEEAVDVDEVWLDAAALRARIGDLAT